MEIGHQDPNEKSIKANPFFWGRVQATPKIKKAELKKAPLPQLLRLRSPLSHRLQRCISLKASSLQESYRNWGHFLLLILDPLRLSDRPKHPTLNPEYHGIKEEDMDVPNSWF